MLLLIIVLILVFGFGGGYYGHSRWGYGGGLGSGLGTVLVILLIAYLLEHTTGYLSYHFLVIHNQDPGLAQRFHYPFFIPAGGGHFRGSR